ncbi:MAG: hypothetical protein LIP02_07485 [Bacteroidales bacterium]|nr:hypothetical protein [Bacteroidales bacterium]
MKRINDIQARALMERFLSADTTLAEERQLRAYFAAGPVADDLAPMAEMMGWYQSLSEQASPAPIHRQGAPSPSPATATATKSRLSLWIRLSAVAASVALIIAMAWSMSLSSRTESPEYLAYQGSYVIVNGHKITDVSQIIDQLKWAESYTQRLNTQHPPLTTHISPLDTLLETVDNPAARQLILETLTM